MKILRISIIFIVAVMLLTSCSIDVTINKGEKVTETTTQMTTTDEWLDDDEDEDENTPAVTSRADLTNQTTVISESTTLSSFTPPENAKEITAKKAIKMYNKYFGTVKSEKIGFTKEEWADIDNINVPSDPTGIVNNILTVVGKNIIKNTKSDALNNAITVQGDEIINQFPCFEKDYVCALENYDCIKSAYCEKADDTVTYYILFNACLNPDDNSDFGKICTPFDREAILEAIKSYVPVADLASLKLDCNYSDCLLKFTIDKDTKKPVSMEQNLYCSCEFVAELNLIIVKTNCLNGSFTLETHFSYYNFA